MNQALYLLRESNVAARRIGSELMIMSAKDSSLFSLNETAALLWEAADGQTSLADIVAQKICPTFDIDPATALSDAIALAEGLAKHGILQLAPTPFHNER